jgi:hypothetical protein
MSEPSAPPPEAPGLTRAKAEAMLAHLSAAVGAPLALDGQNTVAFSYFDDGEATLLFAEPLGYFMLVAPVADPEEIELARLRDLLEFNMEWERPAAIIVPDNDPRPHLAMMLPVDPDDPASLEFAIVNTVRLAGELTAVSGVIDLPAPAAAPVNEHFA